MAQGGGAAGGGGGGGIGRDLAMAGGLALLSSLSPAMAIGVRTGLGAFSGFDQRRRNKKLSEILARHYGTEAGGEVETPSNAGDPAFGGQTPSYNLEVDKELERGPGELGMGAVTEGPTSAPSMFARSPKPSSNKFSELLRIGAEAKTPRHRDQLIAELAGTGAMPPSTLLSMGMQQERAETGERRYQEGRERQERYHQDTLDYRKRADLRSERQLDLSEEAADRAAVAAGRAEDRQAAAEGRAVRGEQRAVQAAALSRERLQFQREKYEASQQLDVNELGEVIKDAENIIQDLEMDLEWNKDTMSEADQQTAREHLQGLRSERGAMLPIYQQMLERAVQPPPTGEAPGMAVSHKPAIQGKRVKYGVDFQ